MKKTTEQIVSAVRRNNAMTEAELQDTLGYRKASLNKRLRRLIMQEEIHYLILPAKSSSAKYNFFKGYTGKRLFYADRDGLMKWAQEKLPAVTNISERRAITKTLRQEFGFGGRAGVSE